MARSRNREGSCNDESRYTTSSSREGARHAHEPQLSQAAAFATSSRRDEQHSSPQRAGSTSRPTCDYTDAQDMSGLITQTTSRLQAVAVERRVQSGAWSATAACRTREGLHGWAEESAGVEQLEGRRRDEDGLKWQERRTRGPVEQREKGCQ